MAFPPQTEIPVEKRLREGEGKTCDSHDLSSTVNSAVFFTNSTDDLKSGYVIALDFRKRLNHIAKELLSFQLVASVCTS